MAAAKKSVFIASLLNSALAFAALILPAAEARGGQTADPRDDRHLLSQTLDQAAAVGQSPGSPLFSVQQNPAAGTPVIAGSLPRSFLIPGTDTSLKISGWISNHSDYWLSGGPPNSSPQTINLGATGQVQAIPLANTLARARSHGIFEESAAPSRLIFETATPTAFGEARTYLSMDWAGSTAYAPGGVNPTSVSDNLVSRIFLAYATLGNFLAGQANSNFRDADAEAEVVEFGGNSGAPGVARIPQIRWTIPIWQDSSLSLSAETPETDIGTPAGVMGSDSGAVSPAITTNIGKATTPDLTAAYYTRQSWGHLDFSTVLRPGLTLSDGQFFSKTYIGFGGHVGLDVKPGWFGWSKDDFTVQLTAGNGLGRYLNAGTNYAIVTNYGCPSTAAGCGPTTYGTVGGATTAASAAAVKAETTAEWGTEIGYQHWWLPTLRSNISAGINHHDIPANIVGAAQAGAMNKELMTVHANLIWSPFSFVDVGWEFMWGRRRVVTNQTGVERALINRVHIGF